MGFSLDTLDDRREIWHLLHRMPPARRLGYLERVCRAVSRPDGTGPRPVPDMRLLARDAERCGRADERLTNAVYVDVVHVCAAFDLELLLVAADLERVAKGQAVPLAASALAPAARARAAAAFSRA